jgi:hypothetical protein
VSRSPREQEWQEGAGALLLLAAANATDLLSQLEGALPMKQQHVPVQGSAPQHLFQPQLRLLLTLLFLNAVGLHRPWDLRNYTGSELGLLTGRAQPYSYRHVERFLRILATANADEAFTAALAGWTSTLWQVKARSQEAISPHVYVDGHRKAVYTDTLIPRGLIGNSGKILGCRALTLLHDDQGHPLLVTTHRGDLHLTNGIPAVLTRYEQATDVVHLTDLVVDREAMAADFLAQMSMEGRTMTTILKTNQYSGLDSFTNVGPFVPLTVDRHGTVLTRPSLLLSFCWLVLIATMNRSGSRWR